MNFIFNNKKMEQLTCQEVCQRYRRDREHQCE